MKKWRIHWCLLDKDCRYYGSPPRIYFHTPWGTLSVTVPPYYPDHPLEPTGDYRDGMPVVGPAKALSWFWEGPFWIPNRRNKL